MHAIRLHEVGAPENLRFEEVDDPKPAPGQVRIAVAAAGVHLIDTKLRRGDPGPWPAPELPGIPGREVAGTIDTLGAGVDDAWLGRRVVAHLGMASAGYAELAVTAVESLHTIADGVDAAEAVAMIGTGRTTMALLDAARITGDDVVLVTSAAGGLGTLAVQAARNIGAVVVGLAGGPSKVERVRALGADVALDYTDPSWPAAVSGALGDRSVTAALDGVGGEIGRSAFELLGPGGRIVMIGFASGTPTELTSAELWARTLTAIVLPRPADLRALEDRALEELAAGRLVPALTRFPLAEAAAAHAALEARATTGKVVLEVDARHSS